MKALLTLLICLICTTSWSQQTSPIGTPKNRVNAEGELSADSTLKVPKVKKTYPYWDSTGNLAVVNDTFWYHNGSVWVALPPGGGGGSGTVTNVGSGYGLTGGPITGSGTLVVDTATLFTKLASTFSSGYGLLFGGRTYEADTATLAPYIRSTIPPPGTGSVTSVATGNGILGGPITSTGTLTADTAVLCTNNSRRKLEDSLNAIIATKGPGTVTSVNAGSLTPLFTTSGGPITTSGSFSYALSNASAHTFFGNFTGTSGAPSYSSPSLNSADFANQGTTTTLLHGNASGNPSWTQIQTGDIAANAVTYAKLQAASTNSLLIGSPSSGSAYQEISLGSGLSMSAGVLSASGGGGGTVTSVGTGYGLTGGPITTTGTIVFDSATAFTQYAATQSAGYGLLYGGRTFKADTATLFNYLIGTFAATAPITLGGRTIGFQAIPGTSVPANTTGSSATPSGNIAYNVKPTASTLDEFDPNANTLSNSFIGGWHTTTSASATVTLTAASQQDEYNIGTAVTNFLLPVASTMDSGQYFHFINVSTGNTYVYSSGSNIVDTVLPNGAANVFCYLTSGTSAASWVVESSISLAGTSGNITISGGINKVINLATAGTAGTYGSATQVPVFTTDAFGRITGVTNTAISAGTVTSVGLGNITGFATAGSTPISTSGTFSYSLTNASAHTYWGNNTGSTVAPGYVSLVSGDIPSLTGGQVGTTGLAANAVTYAKLQAGSTNSLLLGTPSTGGAYQEITIGSGLSMSAGVLSAAGSGGTVTSVSVATANGFSGTVATPTSTPAITIIAGAITPTSVNGNTISTGTGTLTLAAGKTFTASNTLTLAGTDGSTLNVGTGGTLGTNAFNSTSYLPLAGGSMTGAINEAQGTNIASAGTTNLGTATGNYVNITGTTTITGFGTVQAGTRRIVNFNGILTLTNNATSLILPGGANITTAAGDIAEFTSLGSGDWQCDYYERASGTALIVAAAAAGTLTGSTLASGVTASSLTSVGSLNGLTIADANNIVFGTATGTKIGTSTSQKLSFYNATPVVQQSGDVLTALSTYGFGTLTIGGSDLPALSGVVTSSGATTSFGSFTSATLATAVSDETGSGALVFATSPTFVTPALGTPATGNLVNCTFPTLNQNTTGTANIAGGTIGAIPYQSAANTTTVLAATATANKILLSGASAAPEWSTPTFPNASATTRKIIVSDGTNWIASTETYAVPGASGNAMISDGTNWTSATDNGGWTVLKVASSDATTTGQTLVDVTGLVSATLSVSTSYEFEAVLNCATSAVATGTEYGINVTVSPTIASACYMGSLTSSTGAITATTANNTASSAFLTTSSEAGIVIIKGIITTAATGSPVFSIRHLKVTSGTSTVKIGSVLRIRQL